MSPRNSDAEDTGNGTEDRSRRVAWFGDRPVSITVVEAIADITDTPPTELPPLHEYLDTEALDQLVSPSTSQEIASLTVTFEYFGMYVRIDTNQGIEISERSGGPTGRRRP